MENGRRIQVSVMLDPDVRKRVRRAAADDDERISDIVNRALRAMFGLRPREIEAPQSTQSA